MKKLKQILSVLAALVLVVGMTFSSVFAADNDGSITIDPANEGQTYTIYRILDLESYNVENEAFAYKVNDAWKGFFSGNGKGLDYVNISDNGYVSWKENADEQKFAKDALTFAKENKIAPSGSKTTPEDSDSVVFENLVLGYYLVDTTTGSLLGLTTTSPHATVSDKNGIPSVDKKVAEDSANDELGKSNDAAIGDTVNFETTIDAQPGAKNYVLHDTMTSGLTFNQNSVVVKDGNKTLVAGTDYVLSVPGAKDGCTFEISFNESYLSSIEEATVITVTYTATVNQNAVIAGVGNKNTTKLTYGENSETEESKTTTYVWKFDIFKYTSKTDDENRNIIINLAGAEFEIYEVTNEVIDGVATETKTKLSFVVSNGVYKVAATDGTTNIVTSDSEGKIYIEGLDEGTYEVVETKAPDGYNKLKDPFRVVISSNSKDRDAVTLTSTIQVVNDEENLSVEWDASNNQVKVLNTTGGELPTTGGMGTTYLYLAGGLLVIGSAVLMIVRKRMSAE